MKIKGMTKTSLINFPGHLCTTLFTEGCNFNCPYCHNRHLLSINKSNDILDQHIIPIKSIWEHLDKKYHLLDGICISGGEPSIQKDLLDILLHIRITYPSLKIKLDTNGYNPEIISAIIEKQLVDYIAMDIKSTLDKYPEVSGLTNLDASRILNSIKIIDNSPIPHEFRTTLIKEFHCYEDIQLITQMFKPTTKYCLQQFVPQPSMKLNAYSDIILNDWYNRLKKVHNNVELRGVLVES